jgi:2-methylisocitrate lyase-like PEP mutase family enzyme
MDVAADLSALYAAHAEPVTVDTVPVRAFFDGGYAEAFDAAGTAPSLRCIAADVAGVAVGDAVVRAGVNYTVRNVLLLPPDEMEVRLVL